MGCDIHLYVEAKENGVWVNKPGNYYDGRNYELFAILAGVRNRFNIVPICDPRGLPADMSGDVPEEEYGDHSFSWLTLAELMAFDWTQTVVMSGLVNGPEFYRWNGFFRGLGHAPGNYCQGASGGGVRHVDEARMTELIGDATKGRDLKEARDEVENLSNCYCRVEWEYPCWRCATEFLGSVIPQLWRLGAPDDVRIVFGFDS